MTNVSLHGAERFLAHVLTEANSTEQAAFFNEFGRMLAAVCSGIRGGHGFDSQLCYAVREMDATGLAICETLGEFAKMEKETREENARLRRS